jgi:hypothetical protein
MRRVIVESPYAGKGPAAIELNVLYVRAALNHCLHNGDAPFASHGLYTLPGVLDDQVPEDRALGMKAGFAFIETTVATIVYEDLGVSGGMISGIKIALELGHPIERRRISGWERTRPCHAPKCGSEVSTAVDGVLVCVYCGRSSLLDPRITKPAEAKKHVSSPRMGNAGPVAGAARAAGGARGVIKGSGGRGR